MQYPLVMTSNQWVNLVLMSKQEMKKAQEPKDCATCLFTGVGVLLLSKVVVGKHLQVEPLEEEERERTTPMVAFDCSSHQIS